MNSFRPLVFITSGLVTLMPALNLEFSARNVSGKSDSIDQVQFLHALHEGPLINRSPYQYVSKSIFVPKADPDEPRLARLSLKRALDYLDQGAEAWNTTAKCITCHTNGSYMIYRSALTDTLGKPSQKVRDFFVATLRKQLSTPKQELLQELGPTQVIYIAAGLAQWDAHVRKAFSLETRQALALMFDLQETGGAWMPPGNCWPPFESDSYQPATVAAMAVAAAPGWASSVDEDKLRDGIERLKNYLRKEAPPHDYGRVFLLWAASHMSDLLTAEQRSTLLEAIWRHQRPDGGWSIRSFAAPEAWGSGTRAEKLRAESDFLDPPSDGHQTGLAITVLRAAGVPSHDPRIQRGVNWLLSHQRASGRWWTRSLNTNEWHFITYSGTCYALLALSACDALMSQ